MNAFLDTVTNWLAGHQRITAAVIVSCILLVSAMDRVPT